MNNLKKYLPSYSALLIVLALMSAMVFTSCSKDDDSDEPGNQAGSNELVGTWYFSDDGGDIDYNDYFIFNSNGTGTYHYDDEESDDFSYTYDSKTNVLSLNYKHWESERMVITWFGKNAIDTDYGRYVRK